MNDRLEKIKKEYREKGKEYITAVQEEYPIGSIVSIEIDGNILTGIEIYGHTDCWHNMVGKLFGKHTHRPGIIEIMPSSILECDENNR